MNTMTDGNLLLKSVPAFMQLESRFDTEYGVLWGLMDPLPRPCFNETLLEELHQFVQKIQDGHGSYSYEGKLHPLSYGVIASKTPGVFNLGGDLALFKKAILDRDRSLLVNYGHRCISNQFPWYEGFGRSFTTISLVQGDALGGGFECALSSSVIIAEESSRMGFPEVLFNLFPGMGAYSFLARKVGRREAERLIVSGNIYTARELFDLGVIDVITPDGTGEAAVYSFIKRHSKSLNARRGLEQIAREFDPITYGELARVVEIWADAAMRLEPKDLRMMERLLRAQARSESAAEFAVPEKANVVRLEPTVSAVGDD